MPTRRLPAAADSREFLYGWIDVHAAVAHLGLGSQSALYDLIREHNLPFGRIGRHYRFRRFELDEWASKRQAGPVLMKRGA